IALKRAAALKYAVGHGRIPASDLAEMTLKAVEKDQFYVFPHRRIKQLIKLRAEAADRERGVCDSLNPGACRNAGADNLHSSGNRGSEIGMSSTMEKDPRRLIYLGIPLMAVMLAACGDDERDDRVHEEPIPTTTDEYNTTPGSAPMDTPPANG